MSTPLTVEEAAAKVRELVAANHATAIKAVRYRPDRFSDYVIELVPDEKRQAELVRHLILDLGIDAEPVTLVPQPDAPAQARIRRGIAEDAINDYVADEITDDKVFGILARLTPALHDLDDAAEVFEAIEHTAEAYLPWQQARNPDFDLRSVEPELRPGEVLVDRLRVLLDEELDALMTCLDTAASQHASGTETKREVA